MSRVNDRFKALFPRSLLNSTICECDDPQGEEAYCPECGSATVDEAPEPWCHSTCGQIDAVAYRPRPTHRQQMAAVRSLTR